MGEDRGPGIREARTSDATGIRQLIHETIRASYRSVYPPRAVEYFLEFHSEERIVERLAQGTTLLMEADGQVVATGSIVGSEILGVFVRRESQKRGLGAALMHDLESRAMERGFTEVEPSVSLPSRRFYEALGYEVREECSLDLGEGQRLDYWVATKSLA